MAFSNISKWIVYGENVPCKGGEESGDTEDEDEGEMDTSVGGINEQYFSS